MFGFTAINHPAAPANGQSSTANASNWNVRGRKRGRSCECFDNRTVKQAELVVNHLCDHRRERKAVFHNPNRIPITNRLARPRNNSPTFPVFDPARDPMRNIIVDRNGNQVSRRAVASQAGPSRRREPPNEPEVKGTANALTKAPAEPSEGSRAKEPEVKGKRKSIAPTQAPAEPSERSRATEPEVKGNGKGNAPTAPAEPSERSRATEPEVKGNGKGNAPTAPAEPSEPPRAKEPEKAPEAVEKAPTKPSEGSRAKEPEKAPEAVEKAHTKPSEGFRSESSRESLLEENCRLLEEFIDMLGVALENSSSASLALQLIRERHNRRTAACAKTGRADGSPPPPPPQPEIDEDRTAQDVPRTVRDVALPLVEALRNGTPFPAFSEHDAQMVRDARAKQAQSNKDRSNGVPRRPVVEVTRAPLNSLPCHPSRPDRIPDNEGDGEDDEDEDEDDDDDDSPDSSSVFSPPCPEEELSDGEDTPRPHKNSARKRRYSLRMPAVLPSIERDDDESDTYQRARELSEQRRAQARARAKSEQRRALEDTVRNWHPTAAPRDVKPPATAQQATPPSIRGRPHFRRIREESIDFASTANRMAALPKIIEQHFRYD
ncbi:hypothetical protein LZ554_000007 [Drepanopeziza brunnea f. sp. 'monogermtubi']|nr:hypothetical protein LZ554_000007 [Drepanopeziza brunnea f. sp. 'monogermtubi']